MNSLKTKLTFFFCLMIIFFVIVKSLDLHFIQLPQLYALEAQSDSKDINRIKKAFQSLTREMSVINYDNAVWDDSYNYINDRNEVFPESNFVIDAYKGLGLNGIYLYDHRGQNVWGKSLSRVDWTVIAFSAFDLPSEFVKNYLLVTQEQFKKNAYKPVTHAGFTFLADKLLIFSSTSITQANLQPHSNGTMLFWRFFDDDILVDLRQRAGINFDIKVLSNNSEDNPLLLSSKGSFKVDSYRTEQGIIYDFMPFIIGSGGIKISYQAPERQFISTWFNRSTVITTLLFLLTLLMISLFVHYVIIHPLLSADKIVKAIIKKNDYSVRFSSHRKDELGTLFTLIDRLLENVASSEQELISHNLRLQKISRTDGLTNIPNRRAFDLYMIKLLAMSPRGVEVSILIGDVDYFKKYNDGYGHAMGDKALCAIADVLRKNLHEDTDFIARYGGEEFVIVLNHTNEKNAISVANNLVTKVRELNIPHKDSEVFEMVTISIGLHTFIISGQEQYMSLFEIADQALYQAKDLGRNRVSS